MQRIILFYSRNEMIGNWLGRYLPTNDLEKFETIRQRYCKNTLFIYLFFLNNVFILVQHEQPTSVCDIFDIYTNNGDGRLTFLYQIRPIRERRSKVIKFYIVAQLIE